MEALHTYQSSPKAPAILPVTSIPLLNLELGESRYGLYVKPQDTYALVPGRFHQLDVFKVY